MSVNPLSPDRNQHPNSQRVTNTTEVNRTNHENLGNNHQRWKFLIIKQLLPAGTITTVWRTVGRICLLTVGLKELLLLRVLREMVKTFVLGLDPPLYKKTGGLFMYPSFPS